MKKTLAVLMCVVLMLTTLPVISVNAAQLQWIDVKLNSSYEVTLNKENDYAYYCFTPDETGVYEVQSQGADYVYVFCYDENHELIDYGEEYLGLFFLQLYMEKGKKYYCVMTSKYDIQEDEKFLFYIEKLADINIPTLYMETGQDVITSDRIKSNFFSFTPYEDGYYALFTYGYVDSYAKLYDSEWNYISDDEDSGENKNCSLAYYLEGGKKYYYEVSTADTSDCRVFVDSTLATVGFNVLREPNTTTYYEGYVEEKIDFSGLKLELMLSDGTTFEWEYNEEIVGTTVSVELVKQDDKYYYSIKAGLSQTHYYPLKVLDAKVESISVYSMENITCIENQGGRRGYDENTGETYYIYRYSIPENTKMQINYKDGTNKIVNFGDLVDNEVFTVSDNQGHSEKWGVGIHKATIEYYGATTEIEVEVKETNIDSIVVDKEPKYQIIDLKGNRDSFFPADFKGMVFTINYKDGTSRTFTDADYDINNFMIDGVMYYTQEHEADGPGVYEASINYLGFDIKFNVVILGRGDFDGDGDISILDATTLQRYIVGGHTPTDEEASVADANKDGNLNVFDATHIQRYVASIIDRL